MPDSSKAAKNKVQSDRHDAGDGISLPLYIGGLVVTLAGVLSVSTAISMDGPSTMQTTAVLLTLLGFAFSLACRHLNIQARLIDLGCLAFLIYLGYELITQRMDVGWFLGGADEPDTKLAAGLMWLSVLRAWTLISDDLVMFSCVFTAAMIGLVGTQDINTIIVVYFAAFVLAMTFLLIHQNYLQNRGLAAPKDRARSFAALIPAQMALTVLCGVAVLALGSALISPAEVLFSKVSLATAMRGLVGSGSNPAGLAAGATSLRFSDDSSLDIGLGSIWPTSSEVLLHVAPSDMQPHYWRGRTYDQYLGTSWRSTPDTTIRVQPAADNGGWLRYDIAQDEMLGEGSVSVPPSHAQRLITKVEVRGSTDEFYYAGKPTELILRDSSTGEPRAFADGRIDLDGQPVQPDYTIVSMLPPDPSQRTVQERLRHDGENYPAEIRQLYRGQIIDPDNSITTTEDVNDYKKFASAALANLAPQHNTQFDKVMAIRDWVAARCVYSLDVSPIPPGEDSVRYFLTDSRRGYCDLFASSMAMLCRAKGIPARIATGFAPGDRDATGFNLRALDKHAWVEVYFPGDGWQTFDPTAGSRTDGSVPRLQPKSPGAWSRIMQRWESIGAIGKVLLGIILLALASVVKTELIDRWLARRKRAVRRKQPLRDTEARYGNLTRALARMGLPRRAWETPDEYQQRAISFLAAAEAAWGVALPSDAVVSMTELFIASRYGAIPVIDDSEIDSHLSEFIRATSRARRARFWRRFSLIRPRLKEA